MIAHIFSFNSFTMNTILDERSQVAAVRYIVKDVDSAVQFYKDVLGFHLNQHVKSAFASLSLGNLTLFINQPGAGGAGKGMPDGTMPTPGGWNRFQVQVKDIDWVVENLKKKDSSFRNEIVTGVGGKQILLEDPSGNLIEIFQPAS
jgi:predicted enzyme related to lactoylglutathione lyase